MDTGASIIKSSAKSAMEISCVAVCIGVQYPNTQLVVTMSTAKQMNLKFKLWVKNSEPCQIPYQGTRSARKAPSVDKQR
jgi:hypothetical protein